MSNTDTDTDTPSNVKTKQLTPTPCLVVIAKESTDTESHPINPDRPVEDKGDH